MSHDFPVGVHEYRGYFLGSDGHIQSRTELVCPNDAAARQRTLELASLAGTEAAQMKDDRASLEKLRRDAAECALVRDPALPDDVPMPAGGTVYVLGDDEAVRHSLELLLRTARFEPVALDEPDVFLTAAKTIKAGCLLLDIRLQGMNGLEVQQHLNRIGRDLPVIIVTAQVDIQTAVRAMKAGAIDFLGMPYSDRALLSSIEMAFATGRQSDYNNEIADAARQIAGLSRREREVLDGLMDGHPNKVIAYNLGLSVRTVEVHRARMMARLGTRQLAQALRLGIMSRLNTLKG
ncbi:response regulator [Bradyrhizobium brasilense]|uniref:response regulator transcription factor n=1 Tax=Bradyrhizobium brasilense TaxID=1419277 RepID=UPI0024B24A86|nr:response regulator [Bradyrhizobium australafricanum]WFU34397.1 response regulator [Bradyrhizobium australafricanum]